MEKIINILCWIIKTLFLFVTVEYKTDRVDTTLEYLTNFILAICCDSNKQKTCA